MLRHPLSLYCTQTAPPPTYTLSLHDALPIFADLAEWSGADVWMPAAEADALRAAASDAGAQRVGLSRRSEEHTSELQSRRDLVCRLLLEKKNGPESGRGRRHQSTPLAQRGRW